MDALQHGHVGIARLLLEKHQVGAKIPPCLSQGLSHGCQDWGIHVFVVTGVKGSKFLNWKERDCVKKGKIPPGDEKNLAE